MPDDDDDDYYPGPQTWEEMYPDSARWQEQLAEQDAERKFQREQAREQARDEWDGTVQLRSEALKAPAQE